MQTRQLSTLIALAAVGGACAHVTPQPKADKLQPTRLNAAAKYVNWQAEPRPRARSASEAWTSPDGRPFRTYERKTAAGNPADQMASPLTQLLMPVPVVDAPLPVPSSTQGRPL